MSGLSPARLSPRDVIRVGSVGLRTRPARAILSSLGIAIGIAAMVAVVGISTSSRADLDQTLDALGTNLLTAAPGSSMTGEASELPTTAEQMIGRIDPVLGVSATGVVVDADVYRSDRIPEIETNGLSVLAARTDLLDVTGTAVRSGAWLNRATARHPAVVLGAAAADRLGIGRPGPEVQVQVGGEWFTVVGILHRSTLAPELDYSVLVGWPVAQESLRFSGHATTVYTRVAPEQVGDVRAVLAATANPEAPNEVEVSRPSDALAAQQAAGRAFTGLLLGVGAVALLVGGVGVANTMVISVLERRAEIGLRRALGATRRHICLQFLSESLLLTSIGGLAGVLTGTVLTSGYAATRGWEAVVPAWSMAAALLATVLIGGVAGLVPAVRASRLSPTDALTAP